MAGVNFFKKLKQNAKPLCLKCPLNEGVIPTEEYTGQGKKGILVINETPDTDKSELLKTLRENNIGINDIWQMNALRCPGHQATHKYDKKIACNCTPILDKVVRELKPKKVILTGLYSQRSFYSGRKEMIDSVWKHRGMSFWDSKYNTWVFPTIPHSIVRAKKFGENEIAQALFKRDIVRAIKYTEEPPDLPTLKPKRLITAQDTIDYLKMLLKERPTMAFDYEGTCIKPQRDFARAVSVGIATERTCVAMPLEHPHWTDGERAEVLKYWQRVLRNKKIKKIAHNMNFEMAWSYERFGHIPANMIWDTQLGAHVLDNRSDIYGLKFQAFQRWGVHESAYNAQIDKYLKSDSPLVPNKVLQAPLDLLLKYNAYDALYTLWLYKVQKAELQGREKEAYQFFHRGNDTLTRLHMNGMKVNVDYYKRQQREIRARIKRIEAKLLRSDDAKNFQVKTGRELNLTSPKDLQILFYDIQGLPIKRKTKTGASVDVEALKGMDSKFANGILKMRKLEKIAGTYLDGFLREETNGRIHPFFNLNRVVSFRSSSAGPNFQNVPKRDKEAKKITRTGLIPSPGCVISEVDFSGAEVNTSCAYHRDKNFINYQLNPATDMHRDCAKDIWFLKEIWDEIHPKLSGPIRQQIKGGWTFAEFYGSYWDPCAKLLWEDRKMFIFEGVTLEDHIKKMGITRLGTVSKGVPTPGSFLEHVKKFEDKFWGEMFPQYAKWKKDIVKKYIRQGFVETHLGFRFKGFMNDREACNYPIQGTSFHLLLYTMHEVQKEIDKRGMKTKLIGQIHDSIIADIPKEEVPEYLNLVSDIVAGLTKKYDWLVTPMECECELSDLAENNGTFAAMLEVDPGCIKGLKSYNDLKYTKDNYFENGVAYDKNGDKL